jgi:hypothetical protein
MDLSLATPELKPRCFEIESLTSISTEVREEGYSPSPNTEIDKDEGYPPSPGSISIFCDQNSLLLFQSFLRPGVSSLVSTFFRRYSSAHQTSFLAFLINIESGSNSRSVVRSGSLTNGRPATSPH